MRCRFIDTGCNSAYANMAVDEALLELSEIPALRVYRWNPSAISIGYSQNALAEINMEKCMRNSIAVVRRITGGKAVLHENDVTYSFILPEKPQLLPKDVTESYRLIANALVLAFKKIGVNAQIKRRQRKVATSLCFSSLNWYEITARNKKISGSAQKRIKGKILQHGPLLVDFNYEKNSELLNSCSGLNNAENLKKKITSIKNELNADISFCEIAEAIKYGFQKNFNFDFFDDSLTKKEEKLAGKLEKEKYSTDEWNLKGRVKGE